MKVFISWSGAVSEHVAHALADWLPNVINEIEPFLSSANIQSGQTWLSSIAKQLETTDFGIVCTTAENQAAPWLNFEAGALGKKLGVARVAPIAINLKLADIELPLGQFQGEELSQAGILRLLNSLNEATTKPIESSRLQKSAATWWPQLEEVLNQTPSTPTAIPAPRDEREVLDEILESVRALTRLVSSQQTPSWFETGSVLRDVGITNEDLVGALRISSTHRLDNAAKLGAMLRRLRSEPASAEAAEYEPDPELLSEIDPEIDPEGPAEPDFSPQLDTDVEPGDPSRS